MRRIPTSRFTFRQLLHRVSLSLSRADELKNLAELRDAGILTEEEFQAKKARILGA
jgi:hypothetical protein